MVAAPATHLAISQQRGLDQTRQGVHLVLPRLAAVHVCRAQRERDRSVSTKMGRGGVCTLYGAGRRWLPPTSAVRFGKQLGKMVGTPVQQREQRKV